MYCSRGLNSLMEKMCYLKSFLLLSEFKHDCSLSWRPILYIIQFHCQHKNHSRLKISEVFQNIRMSGGDQSIFLQEVFGEI